MNLESRLAKIDWPSRKHIFCELTNWDFWKALFLGLLWTLWGIFVVFVGSHVIGWKVGIHELLSLIVLPIPMTCLISLFAGWWHQSRRIMWTVSALGTVCCLCWIPLALMGLIMALGFQSIR